MTDISRQEFENLRERVTRIERTLGATVEIVAAEIVGLRTYLDERFAAVDTRFDRLEEKVDSYAAQINAAMRAFDASSARTDRFMRAIADHFSIDLGDP